MIKNGKYFCSPPGDESDFKELFTRLSTAGAGRPVEDGGFPPEPWTPELLADAISQIEANRSGIELRTVQFWFQDNEKGISNENIHCLARIFGCDDPEATSEWQTALIAGKSRLGSKRRRLRMRSRHREAQMPADMTGRLSRDPETEPSAGRTQEQDLSWPGRRFSLAQTSEAVFSRASPLDLPALVFAGAVALGFSSYFLGIHSVTYAQADGQLKQVGFLWAPNWTVLFMVLLPLYFAFVVDLLVFWKTAGRSKLAAKSNRRESADGWARKVEASSGTYWAVLLICLPFAGLFQWIATCLMPLMRGDPGNLAMDWAGIAILRPEIISVPEAVAFTGFAYLYMCFCFYLFFVGLILLYTLAHDLGETGEIAGIRAGAESPFTMAETGLRVMDGIFRCTILGLLVAICMKLQSAYLASGNQTILHWLVDDLFSLFSASEDVSGAVDYTMPTHYSSFLIVLATCVVFLHGTLRLPALWRRQGNGVGNRFRGSVSLMSAVMALLVTAYLLIGMIDGFSILLGVGLLPAIYGLFDPGFGTRQDADPGDNRSVS